MIELFGPLPTGYDVYDCLTGLTDPPTNLSEILTVAVIFDEVTFSPGDTAYAQVRFRDSTDTLPPGIWSASKSVVMV